MVVIRTRSNLLIAICANTALGSWANSCLADDQAVLNEVTVTARRAVYPALGNQPILDTPFTIFSVPAEFIADVQAKSINDLINYQPSATLVSSELSQATEFNIRGFAIANYFVDGLPAIISATSYELPLELFGEVQSVVGPVGFLYGFAPPGGLLTFQSKRPVKDGLLEVSGQYRSNTIGSGTIDMSGYNPSGTVGVRLSAVYEDGTLTSGRLQTEKFGIAANFDFNFSDQTKLEWNNLYFSRHAKDVNYFLYTLYSGPVLSPLDATNIYAAYGNQYQEQIWGSTANLQHKFNSNWSATLSSSYFNARSSPNSSELAVFDPQGDVAAGWFGQAFEDEITTAQLVVKGEFNTGPVSHLVNFGGSWSRDEEYAGLGPDGSPTYFIYLPPGCDPNNPATNCYFSNLYNGFQRADATGVFKVTLRNAVPQFTNGQRSAFVSDTLGVGAFRLILGLRYLHDNTEAQNPSFTSGSDSKTTPTVALMFKPSHDQTLYASYAEGYEGNQTADPAAINAGQRFPPIKSSQYEVGYKFERGESTFSVAAFDIKRNGYQYFLTNGIQPTSVQGGNETHKGFEVSTDFRISKSLRIFGGIQYLDAKIDGVPIDQTWTTPPAIPRWQGKALVDYTIPGLEKTSLNASVLAYGWQYSGNVANPYPGANLITVPGYAIVGVGGRREFACFSKDCTLRVNIENALDKSYFRARGNPGGLVIGEARTYLVSLTAHF
jgi:iron complex outermembrane receptor protein